VGAHRRIIARACPVISGASSILTPGGGACVHSSWSSD
jgi:hypothetical protein